MDTDLRSITLRKITIGIIAAVWGFLTLIGVYQPTPPTNTVLAVIHYGLKYAFLPLGTFITLWGWYELKTGMPITFYRKK